MQKYQTDNILIRIPISFLAMASLLCFITMEIPRNMETQMSQVLRKDDGRSVISSDNVSAGIIGAKVWDGEKSQGGMTKMGADRRIKGTRRRIPGFLGKKIDDRRWGRNMFGQISV